MEYKHTMNDLRIRQGLPLEAKLAMTKLRIREWVDNYGVDGVYVAFSGGKDSTVLLHLVREMYPDVPAVFSDTGLEFPEIREFVKKFDNRFERMKITHPKQYDFIMKPIEAGGLNYKEVIDWMNEHCDLNIKY